MTEVGVPFDPSASPNGTFPLSGLSNGIGTIVLWNNSNWILDLTFPDGSTNICDAWTADIYRCNGPQGQVSWKQDTQLVSNFPPISRAWAVTYRVDESIPGIFPVALVRQTTIGNQIAVATAATSIQNDGLIAGTSLIEAKAGADAQSAVTLDNTGVMTLGNGLGRVGKLFLNDPNSLLSVQGKLAFAAGSLSGVIDVGQTTITHSGTSVAHSLGAIPRFVLPVLDEGAANGDVIGVNFGTMTSTHFTAYTSNPVSTGNVRFLVFGF